MIRAEKTRNRQAGDVYLWDKMKGEEVAGYKEVLIPRKALGLREAVRMVAKLGGFLGRKGDKEPGAIVIWRGLQYLKGLIEGYTVAMSMVKGP